MMDFGLYNIVTASFVVIGLFVFGMEITHRDVVGSFDLGGATIGFLIFFVGLIMSLAKVLP